ncbi:MAG: hypothetical protein GX409_07300 [candidate division Zixibacteria bacterium]|jgi:hypothetical protein|nr:hypothetical protein [candidate division Zixibacteria bacterium]
MAKSTKKNKPADLNKVKRYSLGRRSTKSDIRKFAGAIGTIRPFFDALPEFLKAADLKNLAIAIIKARRDKRGLIWMMGAHPLKVGLSPVIIDLLKNGYITHIAVNGAFVIHDLEIAFWGRTSEEVSDTIRDGSFGMVEETPRYLAEAVLKATENAGLGEAVGAYIEGKSPDFRKYSVVYEAYRRHIPLTVHVGIGTDTIAQHPEYDAAAWGRKSHLDFRILANAVKSLNSGGVVLNIGSAVTLPEVFLKALTVGRNLSGRIENFTAANFDMIQHYRPNENVVRRPILNGGKGYSITGHHEIMLPLLAAAIKSYER